MIKKILISLSIFWIIFLVILINRDDSNPLDQEESSAPVKEYFPEVTQDRPKKDMPEKEMPAMEKAAEVIPFSPLPAPIDLAKKSDEKPVDDPPKLETKKTEEKSPVSSTKSKDFGLVCTSIEAIASRFRLIEWKRSKYVILEDLEKFNSTKNYYPKHTFKIRVPYKEMIHANTKESIFVPTTIKDPNVRLVVQSLSITKKKLSYSNLTQPIGHVILRDFKIGGPPYEITSEQVAPATFTYRIFCEQNLGPQKFFHDLTGKPSGYKFGIWGFEYQITQLNPNEGKLSVMKKDLKNSVFQEKVLVAQNLSL